MDSSLVNIIKANKGYYESLLNNNLEVHRDALTKPLLDAYVAATKENIEACNNCRLDAIRWCLRKYERFINLKENDIPTYEVTFIESDEGLESVTFTEPSKGVVEGLFPKEIKKVKAKKK